MERILLFPTSSFKKNMNGGQNSLNMSLDDYIAQRRSSNLKRDAMKGKQTRNNANRKQDNRFRGRNDRQVIRNPFQNDRFTRVNNPRLADRRSRRMDEDWSHDRFMGGKAAIPKRNLQNAPKPAQQQLSFEASTQVFVGGLDPSLDKDTLVKLFGLIPNMVSVEMDMDSKNQFKGTAVVVYKTRKDAQAAVDKFDQQNLSYNDLNMTMRVRMLGARVNAVSPAESKVNKTGFFASAMDNPDDPRFGRDYVEQA
ncbi:hypothetical protein WA577_006644 [Blastocystis sp. JDR]